MKNMSLLHFISHGFASYPITFPGDPLSFPPFLLKIYSFLTLGVGFKMFFFPLLKKENNLACILPLSSLVNVLLIWCRNGFFVKVCGSAYNGSLKIGFFLLIIFVPFFLLPLNFFTLVTI